MKKFLTLSLILALSTVINQPVSAGWWSKYFGGSDSTKTAKKQNSSRTTKTPVKKGQADKNTKKTGNQKTPINKTTVEKKSTNKKEVINTKLVDEVKQIARKLYNKVNNMSNKEKVMVGSFLIGVIGVITAAYFDKLGPIGDTLSSLWDKIPAKANFSKYLTDTSKGLANKAADHATNAYKSVANSRVAKYTTEAIDTAAKHASNVYKSVANSSVAKSACKYLNGKNPLAKAKDIANSLKKIVTGSQQNLS